MEAQKRIDVTVELAAPLLFGEWRLGNAYDTRPYLPGSALRGAVADALMRDWPWANKQIPHPDECPDPKNCPLCRVFYPQEGPQPRFGDCYPATGNSHPLPLPATARTCKHQPGFILADDPGERHGIFDILIRQAAFEDALESGQRLLYLYDPGCPQCRAKVTPPGRAYYARFDGQFYTAEPRLRRFSRTAINRVRRAAEPNLLFTLTVLGEQMGLGWNDEQGEEIKEATTLQGQVWAGADRAEAVRQALEEVEWLGAVRSRGLGRVKITAKVTEEKTDPMGEPEAFLEGVEAGQFALSPQMARRLKNDEPLNLAGRLLAFNGLLQAEREFWRKLGVPVFPGAWYFSLDLLSDTFLQDEAGLPTLQLAPARVGLAGNGLPPVTKVRSWAEPVYRSGWSGVKKLPRPVKLGVKAGSVYLYRVDPAPREAYERLIKKLARLEAVGLGEERERGAGRPLVCAPFHLEVNPR